MVTYNRSTYQQIVNDVRLDTDEEKLNELSDEAIQGYILRGVEDICDKFDVTDQFTLGLIAGQVSYPFQDRPAISNATNATPIVCTCTAHGFSQYDILRVQDVFGNTAANGFYRTQTVAANTFDLYNFVKISDATNASPIVITTESAHGYTTGNTIVIDSVLGNTAANGSFTVTVLTTTTFSLDGSTGNAVYTSGGYANKAVAGNGSYLYGGRVWRKDELPTYFKDIATSDRTFSGFHFELEMQEQPKINQTQRFDTQGLKIYSDYNSPAMGAMWSNTNVRYLNVYPAPVTSQDVTLYLKVKYPARLYERDNLAMYCPLTSDYDTALVFYTQFRIYRHLKMYKELQEAYTLYVSTIESMKLNQPEHVRERITYQ